MDWATVNNLIAAGIVSLALFLLKGYIGKKLENVATEEDIGAITKAVESVKVDFQKDIEKLKQELSVLTNKHNVLFNEEKEALISFLGEWNVWYRKLQSADIFQKLTSLNGYQQAVASINQCYDAVQMSMSKLELFLNDKEVLKSASELTLKTFEIQQSVQGTMSLLYFEFEKLPAEELKKYEHKMIPATDEVKEIIKQYKSSTSPLFYVVFNERRREFIELSRKYIRKDIIV